MSFRDLLQGVLIVLTILATTSCQTSSKKGETWKEAQAGQPKTSPLHTDPELWRKAVTQAGQNEAAVFAPGERKIYFTSRDRLSHKQRQLYVMDIDTRNERRLTFQDGDVLEIAATPDEGSVFYTSTTDEIKERPALLYPNAQGSAWPATEVYRIRPDDELHERWTESAGFDGFPRIAQEPGRGLAITISRQAESRLILMRSSLKSPGFELVLDRPGTYLHSFTSLDRRAWRAWVEENNKSRASKIVIIRRGGKAQDVVTNFFEIRDLHLWAAKEERGLSSAKTEPETHLLFTAKMKLDGPRQAFWLDTTKNCASAMDLGPGEITSLDISGDQLQVLWTLSQGSNAQIFLDTLNRPTGICQPL